jgi:peptidyl-prolyl cis-trans isomerase C
MTCCTRPKEPAAAAPGAVLAQIGPDAIELAELQQSLAAQNPALRTYYAQPEHKRALLEQLIRDRLLAQEAVRRGLDKSPEVRAATLRILGQAVVKEEQDQPRAAVSENEIAKYYEDHKTEFVRPERARVARLVADTKAKAEELKADPKAFVDEGFQTRAELEKSGSEAMANAAFDAKTPGEVKGPFQTARGWQFLRMGGLQPGIDHKLDDVRSDLRSRIEREARNRRVEELLTKLRAEGGVRIDEQLLAGVKAP